MFIGVKYWTYCFVNIFENPNLILKIVGFTSCEREFFNDYKLKLICL